MQNKKINDIFKFLRRVKKLETTNRYESSLKGGARNTVAEHSWHLAMMVMIIASEYKVDVNIERAISLALLHDIAEASTGDFDAYAQVALGNNFKEKKSELEKSVVEKMTDDISFGDKIYSLWKEYEDQKTIEAKFVKALDKIEGFLHISEVGVEEYIQDDFHSNYADEAVKTFNETQKAFPELKEILDTIKDDLKTQFEKTGVKWLEDKSK